VNNGLKLFSVMPFASIPVQKENILTLITKHPKQYKAGL